MYNRRFGVTVRLSVFRVPARVLIGRDSDCRLACTCGASVFRRRMRDTRLAGAVTTRYALPLARLETRDDDDAAVSAVSRRCPAARTGTRGTERRTRDGDASVGTRSVPLALAGHTRLLPGTSSSSLSSLGARGGRGRRRVTVAGPASSVHGRSFELPQAGHTAPQCADRASARIVYRFAADPPRAAAVAEDRGSGIFRLGVGHCARLLPRVHAFPEITELTSDVDVTTRVDGRRRSIRTACPRTTGPGYTGYEPGPRAG